MNSRPVMEPQTRMLEQELADALRAQSRDVAQLPTRQVHPGSDEPPTTLYRARDAAAGEPAATRCCRLGRRGARARAATEAVTAQLTQDGSRTAAPARAPAPRPRVDGRAPCRSAWRVWRPCLPCLVRATAAAAALGAALAVGLAARPAAPPALGAAPAVRPRGQVAEAAATRRPRPAARTPATPDAQRAAPDAEAPPGAGNASDTTGTTRLAVTELAAGNYPAALAHYRKLAAGTEDAAVHQEIVRILTQRLAERCGPDCPEAAP